MGSVNFGAYHDGLNFAIWVLVRDGLRASPFDMHIGGSQVLSKLGFETVDWRRWVNNIISVNEQHSRVSGVSYFSKVSTNPIEAWAGSKLLIEPLSLLWNEYQSTVIESVTKHVQDLREKILSSFRITPPSNFVYAGHPPVDVTIFSVEYESLIYYPVTDHSIIVATLGQNIGDDQYPSIFNHALDLLSTSSQ